MTSPEPMYVIQHLRATEPGGKRNWRAHAFVRGGEAARAKKEELRAEGIVPLRIRKAHWKGQQR